MHCGKTETREIEMGLVVIRVRKTKSEILTNITMKINPRLKEKIIVMSEPITAIICKAK